MILHGWVQSARDLGGVTFGVLRDRTGTVQFVVDGESPPSIESVVEIEGTVQLRPEGQCKPNEPTGSVEVQVTRLTLLNRAEAPLPMPVSGKSVSSDKDLQMRYRYLEMRKPYLQDNLRFRSKLALASRVFLDSEGCTEVETPVLFKSTAEGAREFIVPTRTTNRFYALPQSPQQYKQLLMVGGIDRYFQIAKCFRDESGRTSRQPEFTQIDIEMSFVTREDVMAMMGRYVTNVLPGVAPSSSLAQMNAGNAEIPRMTYEEALSRFGSDKPDTRFGMELVDLKEKFSGLDSPFRASAEAPYHTVAGFVVEKGESLSRKDIDHLQKESRRFSKNGVLIVKVKDGAWKVPASMSVVSDPEVSKQIGRTLAGSRGEGGDLKDGIIILAAGEQQSTRELLGSIRLVAAERLAEKGLIEIPPMDHHFMWVIDFPLLEKVDEDRVKFAHHPFTACHPEDAATLQSYLERAEAFQVKHSHKSSFFSTLSVDEKQELLSVRSLAYDLVCNGSELGGGSIRVHNEPTQRRMFDLIDAEHGQFSHLLEALRHGAPPHGGIALGFDRLAATLCGTEDIRDVIAFPKSISGNDLQVGSPSPVSQGELDEYHLSVKNSKRE